MGQKILAFEIKRDKREKLQKICDDLGITLMYISSEYYEQQLGALAAIKGFKKKPIKSKELPFISAMIVLSGLNSQELDNFLKAYKKSGMPQIPLRAVLTPDNVFWTPKQLYKELMKEHLFHRNPRR